MKCIKVFTASIKPTLHICIGAGMISDLPQKWLIVVYVTLAMANSQFPMSFPMAPFPPMFQMMPPAPPIMVPVLPPPPPPMQVPVPVPVPMPMPMPIGIAVVPDENATGNQKRLTSTTTTTTTTTTTECSSNNPSDVPSPNIPYAPNTPNSTNPWPENIPPGSSNDYAIAMPMPIPMPMPMPVPMHPPMHMPHMPMPGHMPMPLPGNMPMPMPQPPPVQFAIPGIIPPFCKRNRRHPGCPPCPPCSCNPCTPSFFSYCSSCHIKCRCRNGKNAPIPLPPIPPMPLPGPAYPMPVPIPPGIPGISFPIPGSNIVLVPFAPQTVKPPKKKDENSRHRDCHKKEDSSSSEEDSDSLSSESEGSQKKGHLQYDIYRRSHIGHRDVDFDHNDSELVKPELNYLSDDGEVKYKRRLNKHDASILIGENYSTQRVHKATDPSKKRKSKHNKSKKSHKMKNIVMVRGKEEMYQNTLNNHRKELMSFAPAYDHTMSNLPVSYNIA